MSIVNWCSSVTCSISVGPQRYRMIAWDGSFPASGMLLLLLSLQPYRKRPEQHFHRAWWAVVSSVESGCVNSGSEWFDRALEGDRLTIEVTSVLWVWFCRRCWLFGVGISHGKLPDASNIHVSQAHMEDSSADAQLDRDGLMRNLPAIYWASCVEGWRENKTSLYKVFRRAATSSLSSP